MRLPVSLLVLCAGLTGCATRSASKPELVDTINVTSNPVGAAVRLNNRAVGRTPTKVQVDRTENYVIEIGKGGYKTETAVLKPRVISTRDGLEYGFPENINVTLTELTGDAAKLSPADEAEFKRLSARANGLEAVGAESLEADLLAVKEASEKIKADLAVREANSKNKLAQINQAIADIRAGKQEPGSAARLQEAQNALKQAVEEAERTFAQGQATIRSLESRRLALEAQSDKSGAAKVAEQIAASTRELNRSTEDSNQKIAAAKASLDSASESPAVRLTRLEKAAAEENAAVQVAQGRTTEVLNALSARAAELARIQASLVASLKAESSKEIEAAKAELAAAKAATAKAINERNAALNAAGATAVSTKDAEAKLKAAEAKAAAAEDSLATLVAAAKAETAAAKAKADKEISEIRSNTDKAIQAARDEGKKLLAETQAKLAEAEKAAEQAVAKAKAEAEAAIAEAKAAAAAAAKKAQDLAYSEFNARYALLENRFRTKAISESEYKQQLAALRKELGL